MCTLVCDNVYYEETYLNVLLQVDDTTHQKNFTYLRVTYSNIASKMKVIYKPEQNTISFYIILPFLSTPFEIEARALPVGYNSTEKNTTTTKYFIINKHE